MSFKFEDRQLVIRVPLPGNIGRQCCLPVGVVSFVTAQVAWNDPKIYDGSYLFNPLFRDGYIRTWAMGNNENSWCPAFYWERFWPSVDMVENYMDNMRRLSRHPITLEESRWYKKEDR